MPPSPTVPASPNPVARPWAPAAVEYSPAVRPVSAQAVRLRSVDLEAAQGREVEHDPALGGAVAGGAVAAAADGQLGPGLARERDDAGDVGGVGGADDHGRAAVDRAHEDAPRVVVVGVVGRDDPAVDVVGEAGSREHASRVTSRTACARTESHCSRRRVAIPRPRRMNPGLMARSFRLAIDEETLTDELFAFVVDPRSTRSQRRIVSELRALAPG